MAGEHAFPVRDCHLTIENEETILANEELFSRGNGRLRALSLSHRHLDTGHAGDATAEDLAATWISFLDKAQVDKAVVLCGSPAARDFTARIVKTSSGRLLGFTCLDPLQTWSAEELQKDVARGFVGLTLRPTLQHFHVYDRRGYGLFEACERMKLPVMVHLGMNSSPFMDVRFANPLDLQPVARDFPDVPFIIPHLGAGFFREILMLLTHTANVFVDTAGSQGWRNLQTRPLSLEEIFRRVLDVTSPQRILFGSYSGQISDGYRTDRLDEQRRLLSFLEYDAQRAIFGGNLEALIAKVDRTAAHTRTSRLMLRRWQKRH